MRYPVFLTQSLLATRETREPLPIRNFLPKEAAESVNKLCCSYDVWRVPISRENQKTIYRDIQKKCLHNHIDLFPCQTPLIVEQSKHHGC